MNTTIKKIALTGAAAAALLMAGCAEGPYYGDTSYYPAPYYGYNGPYYPWGGVVVTNGGYYRHGYYGGHYAHVGGYYHGGYHGTYHGAAVHGGWHRH